MALPHALRASKRQRVKTRKRQTRASEIQFPIRKITIKLIAIEKKGDPHPFAASLRSLAPRKTWKKASCIYYQIFMSVNSNFVLALSIKFVKDNFLKIWKLDFDLIGGGKSGKAKHACC